MFKLWEWDPAYSQIEGKCYHWIKRIKKRALRKSHTNRKKLSTKIDWKIKGKRINNPATSWAKEYTWNWVWLKWAKYW